MGDDDSEEDVPSATNSGNKVAPMGTTGIPPGLSYLSQLSGVFIKQNKELAEVILGFECNNKYVIKDQLGRDIFQAKEDSCCLSRQCCGPARGFDMKITDFAGMEVIRLQRPCKCGLPVCCSGFCCCCLQKIDVFAPPGNLVGTVEQTVSLIIPKYEVKDGMGEVVFLIKGPCITMSCCCGDVEFKIFTRDGSNEVGKISKKWSGLLTEGFTDADNFGISFPMDLDARVKATLIGACMLIVSYCCI
ncbi:unnamed protein product [Orchesella dallaii]|uniref:Phospholipid scramblase n=1 Tax=Orchesella dallaii TaxID=48710 RepID=A0ABP1S6S5_9HEXA